jgi:hypothetical protein
MIESKIMMTNLDPFTLRDFSGIRKMKSQRAGFPAPTLTRNMTSFHMSAPSRG